MIYVGRQRGCFRGRARVTVTRTGVIMQLLAGKRETQPADEAHPAHCCNLLDIVWLLFQSAGWLIFFSLGGTQRLHFVVICVIS